MKIAVFYHCLFSIGERVGSSVEPARTPLESGPLPAAIEIVREQIKAMTDSGLLEAADRLFIGVNGGAECFALAAKLFPPRAIVSFHGLACRNELRTILMLERFVKEVSLLESEEWAVCYHHSKGATHTSTNSHNTSWRRCMERHVISDWRACVSALSSGYDAAGAHYLRPPVTPPAQHIFAGNFFWARSRFLASLPALYERERIKVSGVDALESRFEAEVYIGNGGGFKVYDLHPVNPSVAGACDRPVVKDGADASKI